MNQLLNGNYPKMIYTNNNVILFGQKSPYSHDSFVIHGYSSSVNVQTLDFCTAMPLNTLCIQYTKRCYSSYTWEDVHQFFDKSLCYKVLYKTIYHRFLSKNKYIFS